MPSAKTATMKLWTSINIVISIKSLALHFLYGNFFVITRSVKDFIVKIALMRFQVINCSFYTKIRTGSAGECWRIKMFLLVLFFKFLHKTLKLHKLKKNSAICKKVRRTLWHESCIVFIASHETLDFFHLLHYFRGWHNSHHCNLKLIFLTQYLKITKII